MARKRRPDGMPRVTLKNINRVEKGACGWRVQVKRRPISYVQYFPDAMDGPFESLRAAIAWRDDLWHRIGLPTHVPKRVTKRNTSGILGVCREVRREASGRIVENWVASWMDGRRRHRRAFSIDKYGEDDARQLAIDARDAGVSAATKGRHRRLLEVLHTHKVLVGNGAVAPARETLESRGAERRRA